MMGFSFKEALEAMGGREEESPIDGIRVFTFNPKGEANLSHHNNETQATNPNKPAEVVIRVYGKLAEALILLANEIPAEVQRRLDAGSYTNPEHHEFARRYIDAGGEVTHLADTIEEALWTNLQNAGRSNFERQADEYVNPQFIDRLNTLGREILETERARQEVGNDHAGFVTVEIANSTPRETR